MGRAHETVRVLVVEDDPDLAEAINRKLTYVGYQVEVAGEPRALLDRIRNEGANQWEVVLLDVGLPGLSGIDVLRQFRERGTSASIVMLTGDDSASTATSCLRAGAFHYITKPVLPIDLAAVVEQAARFAGLKRRLAQVERSGISEPTVIGTSPAIQQLRVTIERVARHEASILIQGESGTGKEVVARALHEAGPRAAGPFVAINCSAISPGLIDSELFGHTKGAFTGATADRPGVFVEAGGGTLFLDEIGDMPLDVQAKLLRVLQEHEVRPVGGTSTRPVDARVIAATHVNLADAVTTGRFRSDLFYRLNVVVIEVPPLRERLKDVPELAAHFLRKHGGPSAPVMTPEALDAIVNDSWPGNVRDSRTR